MNLTKQNIKQILFIIACSIIMVFAAFNFSVIIRSVSFIISVFSPFLIGLCIAFSVNLLIVPIEKLWLRIFKKAPAFCSRSKRIASVFLSLAIVCGAIFLILCIIIPQIYQTVSLLVKLLPKAIGQISGIWDDATEWLGKYSIVLPKIETNQEMLINKISEFLSSKSGDLFNDTISTTSSMISVIFKSFVGLIFSIYILAGKEKLGRQLRKLVAALLPEDKANRLFKKTSDIGNTFKNYITGQLIEAVILGTLCFFGMLLFRIPYAAVISVMVGVTALIPMFGALIGTAVGAFLILAVNPVKALWFIVFIVILQQFEGNVIYPHVVGKSVGLPGIWVLLSVTVGGSLFGVIGMMLSVPIFSVIYFDVIRFVNTRLKEKKKKT